MSTAMLDYVCPVCRTSVDLDAAIAAAVDDVQARRLMDYLIKTYQPTLAAQVVRYLRLHTPPKHRLSWARARRVLEPLVEAMRSRKIHRSGRDWPVTVDDWSAAFTAVFEAHEKGTLVPPLRDNNYLYAVLQRLVDKSEAAAEARAELEKRQRRSAAADAPVADAIAQAVSGVAGVAPAPAKPARPATRTAADDAPVQGLAARRMRAERDKAQARRERLLARTETPAEATDATDPETPNTTQEDTP